MAAGEVTAATIKNPVINTPFAGPGRHSVMVDGQPNRLFFCQVEAYD